MDGTLLAGARYDLTDDEWLILAALLPVGSGKGGPRRWTLRQLINGVRFRTRDRLPVAACPSATAPASVRWQCVYGLFRVWQLAGRWAAIETALQALADAAGLIEWTVSVDSTVNRAHQHAAGARRHPDQQAQPPVGEPADHALGRSRGGLSTKVHLAVEQGRKPLAHVLTAGQAADSPQFTAVLGRIRVPHRGGPGRPRTRPQRVLADRAYASRGNRAYLRRRGIPATIPKQGRPAGSPPGEGLGRRSATGVRPRALPAASCRRVRHQSAQAKPRLRHPV